MITQNKQITFALTSCGRPDLLEKTMDSFFEKNTYPITKYIIIEDSNILGINNHLKEKYKKYNVEWIENELKLGQIKSIDKMYSKINTEYIFHCEEDWFFTKESFIEKSLEILENDTKIVNVWLRNLHDTNGHPVEDEIFNANGVNYRLLSLGYLNVWHGFSFNPGLRRLSDYNLIKPYFGLVDIKIINSGVYIDFEAEAGIKYKELGFRSVILTEKHVEHIGWGRHIN
jgi:hypothetical protein